MMPESKHQQSDLWDACMKKCPPMYCGRLDMATWNAKSGECQKMVYFDGEDGRVVCEGRRADFVAYAANRYQPMAAQIAELRELLERTKPFVQMAMPDLGENHHCGGPDSCCDCDCMAAAEIGELLRDIDKVVGKAGNVGAADVHAIKDAVNKYWTGIGPACDIVETKDAEE